MSEIPRPAPDMGQPSQEMLNLELSMQNQADKEAAIDDAMKYVNRTIEQMTQAGGLMPEMADVYEKIGKGKRGQMSVQEQLGRFVLEQMKSFTVGRKDMDAIRNDLKEKLKEKLTKMAQFAESKRQQEQGKKAA